MNKNLELAGRLVREARTLALRKYRYNVDAFHFYGGEDDPRNALLQRAKEVENRFFREYIGAGT